MGARGVLLATVPVAFLLIAFDQWILLIFGEEFTVGGTALTMLISRQLFNAVVGSAGNLLSMTRHERDTAIGVGIAAVVNMMLNAFLMQRWGIEGAVTTTATSLVMWNLFLSIKVIKKIGIYSTALGRFGLKRVT